MESGTRHYVTVKQCLHKWNVCQAIHQIVHFTINMSRFSAELAVCWTVYNSETCFIWWTSWLYNNVYNPQMQLLFIYQSKMPQQNIIIMTSKVYSGITNTLMNHNASVAGVKITTCHAAELTILYRPHPTVKHIAVSRQHLTA